MKLMFVFAHPDDETFSSGGTIARYAYNNHKVYTVCLTSTPERKREYMSAVEILKVKQAFIFEYSHIHPHQIEIQERLIELINDLQPTIIVTHLDEDYHIEHHLTYNIVREAIEWAAHETQHNNAHMVSKLYSVETTVLIPRPHVLVDISDYYQIKEEAMRCYSSQLNKGGRDFYIHFHKYRTLMRGTQANCTHAEAYIEHPLIRNGPFYPNKSGTL